MTNKRQNRDWTQVSSSRVASVVLALTLVLGLAGVVTESAQAQTFTVLYTFTGGVDGADPITALTRDAAGNLYGTTSDGGPFGCDNRDPY